MGYTSKQNWFKLAGREVAGLGLNSSSPLEFYTFLWQNQFVIPHQTCYLNQPTSQTLFSKTVIWNFPSRSKLSLDLQLIKLNIAECNLIFVQV